MAQIDIHEEITNKLITLMETTDKPESFLCSLASQGLPGNPSTSQKYNGINVLALWIEQVDKGFSSNEWATFKQWKTKGASVIKGQKSSRVIFYKKLEKESDGEKVFIPMLRNYSVFNAEQVEGYEKVDQNDQPDLVERNQQIDQFVENTGANIINSGDRAFYSLSDDVIHIPEFNRFRNTGTSTASDGYYHVLLHELAHWTGHPQRLGRDYSRQKQKYAYEELIAELGSAFLCASLGVMTEPREDHAHYLKSWLSALKNDKKLLFKASADASRAAAYLDELQGE